MRSQLAIATAVAIGAALILVGCGTAEDPIASSAIVDDADVPDGPRPFIPEPLPEDGAVLDTPGNDGVRCPEGLARCGDVCQDPSAKCVED